MQNTLKRRIFCSTISQKLPEICEIPIEGNLYELLCPYFGLSAAPKIFTKLIKIPISLLRRLSIFRILIYLDDMLLMGATLYKFLMPLGVNVIIL